MTSYQDATRRIEAARGNKQLWESTLRECYRYAMPERNTIDKFSPGEEKNLDVFDSTATDALEDYANKMESQLVPPTVNWMMLESGTDIPEEQKEEIAKFLEDTTSVVFDHIRSSNFSSQVHESFLDLAISTGALIVEAGDGIQSSLNFRSVSLSNLILERSSKGTADTVWQDITVQAGDIKRMWPDAKLTDGLIKIISEKPEEDVTFIEGTMLTDNGMYESVLMYPAEKVYLIQVEVESSHWVVFRETTISGEVYGRGRVMQVLPDIRMINAMKEDYLKALNLQANPIFLTMDDGVINNRNNQIKPGTMAVVDSNDSRNPSISQLQVSGQIQLLEYEIRALQDVIRRKLLSKPFGNVEETPVRTATEMSMRNAEAAQTQLGASGRIQSELLERLVSRCVYVLKGLGKIAEFKVDGKEVGIKFTSPMAKQQDEAQLAIIGRFMETMAMLPPEVIESRVKIEDIPKEVADILGLPKSLMRSELEVQQKAQEQQQMMMAQQQAELAQQGGGQ